MSYKRLIAQAVITKQVNPESIARAVDQVLAELRQESSGVISWETFKLEADWDEDFNYSFLTSESYTLRTLSVRTSVVEYVPDNE